jgi:transposase
MKKRSMSVIEIKRFDRERFRQPWTDDRLIVGLDVAKRVQYVCMSDASGLPQARVSWRMPDELFAFVSLLSSMGTDRVEVVMEPSGTYGDAIRFALEGAGIAVFRMSPKRVFDAREVYDGIPSLHDKKSAELLARMHAQGLTRRWERVPEPQRDLRAAVTSLDWASRSHQTEVSRLEALLARHWPESTDHLSLGSVTLWTVLAQIGGPLSVSNREHETAALAARTGRRLVKGSSIKTFVASASTTVGVPATAGEEALLSEAAALVLETHRRRQAAAVRVRDLLGDQESAARMSPVVGFTTAAVIVSELGDPQAYDNAKSLEKAAGLTLKEKSSGVHQGRRSITKRGSSRVRQWLYFAALRLIKTDPVTRAWCARKAQRDGGVKKKAVVAVMRKLLRALWHVARGARFDTTKLFDVTRLDVAV